MNSIFYDWDEVRAELHDGDEVALAAERARTEAWAHAFHLAEERKRLGLTQRDVAQAMGITPGRVSQIENGDLDVNETSTKSRHSAVTRKRSARNSESCSTTARKCGRSPEDRHLVVGHI
jgi:DNA-binding XRE family transcriptional regulator